MLFADKAALENRTKVRLLSIRERELTLYTNNCRTVGTVSALMAGIAYSALIYTKMAYFHDSSQLSQFLYVIGLTVCMCLSLSNVLGTTMLTMLGPGKALRGPDGSMHAAVDGMLNAFEEIAIAQHLTIYTFMLTTIFYAWGAASPSIITSTLLTTLVGGLTYIMYIQSGIVERAFPMRSIPLVSGAFFPKRDPADAPKPGAPRYPCAADADVAICSSAATVASSASSAPSVPLPRSVPLPPPPPMAGGMERIHAQQRAARERQQQPQPPRQQYTPPPPPPPPPRDPASQGYQQVQSPRRGAHGDLL